ncbi:hypothetical protein DL239_06455 [Sedimentitalea sp. CY04]|uniref:Glycerophosphoryl diester phosphodiesterase membrane domain-containing protein n=1 Tax=Parasedimentitalea denitrificans TaxID=2211118 RepID=A0ABX0W8L0_9RHOB|nr:hypothetical protein [Sedimentitalea sp. CY04]NIZ60615.1 hypothetical protein [Sedimentitalea sp. CY04]
MKGWSIFSHSVGMVTRNLSEAMRVALVPVLIGFVLIAALVMTSGLSMDTMTDEAAMEQMFQEDGVGAFFLTFSLSILVFFIMELWIFVSWHRFILLEEYPNGWVPEFRFDRILAYAGRGIMIGIIVMLLWIPAMILTFLLGPLAIIGVLGTVLFMVVLIYRLVAILPAAAIGRPLTIGQAWEATRGSSGTILVLMVVIFLAQILLQVVSGLSMMVFPPLGIAFQLFAALVMSLVNVSILTTFYGHYVEGREIG